MSMDQVYEFSWKGVTLLAKMDEQTESMTSLPRRSRFVVIVVLCFCVVGFMFLYTSSEKPTVRSIEELKKTWSMGQYNPRRISQQQKKWQTPPDVTHAQSSSYRFGGSSGLVTTKGSTLRLVIEARNRAGKRTKTGGDMWYATLNSLKPKASTAGKVHDNGDGTYDVTFYAGWEGVAKIDVILVHPKEACSLVAKKVWPAEDRVVWEGLFKDKNQGNKLLKETCVLRRNETDWAKKCEYWYPDQVGRTMLICGKPTDRENLACSDMYALKSLDARISLAASELIEGKEYLFENENIMQIIENGPKHVKIEGGNDYRTPLLPVCRSDLETPKFREGYWLSDKWQSLRCHNPQWGINSEKSGETTACFRGKEVYFLGDTSSRQWFEAFQESIGLKFYMRNDDKQYRLFRHHPSLNLSVLYQARPMQTISAQVPFEEVKFEVDVLDGLQDPKCNYVVVVSAWSDTYWDRVSFVEKTNLLKNAILQMAARCPSSPVFVTGPHPVEHKTYESQAYADNILLWNIRDLLADTFRDTSAIFLDVWDLSLAYPSPNKLDMPLEVVRQGVNLLMSYVCRTPKTDPE